MTIPEGWKLVPVEPTPAMTAAYTGVAEELTKRHFLSGSYPATWQLIEAGYAAMLAAAPTPPTQDDECAPDPWHAAIDNELVCCHILNESNHNDPRKALQDIINWHVQVALDPAVSSDAQALIERGKQDDEALEVLRELVEARDAYNASETTPQLRDNSTRLREAGKAARALIAKRGEK